MDAKGDGKALTAVEGEKKIRCTRIEKHSGLQAGIDGSGTQKLLLTLVGTVGVQKRYLSSVYS